MTLEAWVNPTTVTSAWRDVIYKGNDNYYLRRPRRNASRPAGGVIVGGSYADAFGTAALPANTWTLPGRDLRRRQRCASTSTAPRSRRRPAPARSPPRPTRCTIGGDSIYGQYFSGLIDDVRIYNIALTASPDPDRHDHPGRPSTDAARRRATLTATAVSASRGRPQLGRRHRQRRRHRLPGRALPGRRLHATSPRSRHRPAPRYNDTSVTANTSYSYRVRAIDARRQPRPLLEHRHRRHRALTVTPRTAVLTFTRTQQFTASGAGSGSVTWSVDGVAGGNATVGHDHDAAASTRRRATVGTHTVTATAGSRSRERDRLRDELRRARSRTTTTTCATGAEPERDGAHAGERQLDELRQAVQLPARRPDVRLAALRRRT